MRIAILSTNSALYSTRRLLEAGVTYVKVVAAKANFGSAPFVWRAAALRASSALADS